MTELTLASPSRLLTAPQVAELLGVSAQWVYKQAQAGQMPFVHLGEGPRSPLRVDPNDLTLWLRDLKKLNDVDHPAEQLC